MARSVNIAILIGNLGKDPDLRYTGSGVAVASFSLATSETWKDAEGNQKESTQWHNVVAWRKLAEIVGEYAKKGSKLYVKGKITHRSYDDKDGVKRWITEVVADEVVFLDSKKSEDATAEPGAGVPAPAKDDDLPFN